jgi:hypothetical protein
VPAESEAAAAESGASIAFDVVPESHHHVTLDNPGGVVRVVRRFLDRTEGQRAA